MFRIAVFALGLSISLGGCSASVDTGAAPPTEKPPAVPAQDLAVTVKEKLLETVGTSPTAVDCPDAGLRAERGATLTCELTAPNGDIYDVVLTATGVDDATGDVNFDFKVGDQVKR